MNDLVGILCMSDMQILHKSTTCRILNMQGHSTLHNNKYPNLARKIVYKI